MDPFAHAQVILTTFQVPELLLGLGSETAIIYYEQGHEWLFGDLGQPMDQKGSSLLTPAVAPCSASQSLAMWGRVFHMVMGLPVVIAAVSEPVRAILSAEFGRGRALLLPNGIDASGQDGLRPLTDAVQGMGDSAVQRRGDEPYEVSIPENSPPVSVPTNPRPRVAEDQHEISPMWVAAGLPPPTQIIGRAKVNCEFVNL